MRLEKDKDLSWLLKTVYELCICLYIIAVPLMNTLKDYTFVGYALHVWAAMFVLVMTVVVVFSSGEKKKPRTGFPILILVVFIIDLLYQKIQKRPLEIGAVLCILLYVAFLMMPKDISLKRIYMAYYVAAILSAISSLYWGSSDSGVARTATKIDGSISVIVIMILFWAKEPFQKTSIYNTLKRIALPCCYVVAGFGMSRARLLILAILTGLKLFAMLKNMLKTGKVNAASLILFPFVIVVIFLVLRTDVTQNLWDAISSRFEDGMESLGRDDELTFGLNCFRAYPIFGRGWGPVYFRDYQGNISRYFNHCVYVAILARGGVLMGVPFFASFLSLIKKVSRKKDRYCLLAAVVFFALGYGNAGFLNYTICGMLIPIVMTLNNSDPQEQPEAKEIVEK